MDTSFSKNIVSAKTGQLQSLLKKLGGQGCVLVGHPSYYKRLGFQNFPALVYEGAPQEVFFALPFAEKVPKGIVVFHAGFLATGQSDSRG